MACEMEWHLPYCILKSRISGRCTDEDTITFTSDAVKFLTEAQTKAPDQTVYNVLDTLEAESFPPIYLMLPRALPTMRFKNRGPLYLVTSKQSIRHIFELTAHIMAFPIRAFSTWDEAIEAAEMAATKDMLRKNIS